MELIQIGKFTKTFGTEGFLRCKIEEAYLENFLSSKHLFVKLAGQPVPFFPEQIEKEPELQVQLDELTSRESAQQLTGKAIFLRPEDFTSPAAASNPDLLAQQYERWRGFTIIDQELGKIAPIEDFMELPQQILAVINYKGKEVLIPFTPEIILDIDEASKTLSMDLPDGLLDL